MKLRTNLILKQQSKKTAFLASLRLGVRLIKGKKHDTKINPKRFQSPQKSNSFSIHSAHANCEQHFRYSTVSVGCLPHDCLHVYLFGWLDILVY